MAVPPINEVLQPPVDRVEIQADAQLLAFRKALSNHVATSVVERCESNVSPAFLVRSARPKAWRWSP